MKVKFRVKNPRTMKIDREAICKLLDNPNLCDDGLSVLWDCFLWDKVEPGNAYWAMVASRLENGGSLTEQEFDFLEGLIDDG